MPVVALINHIISQNPLGRDFLVLRFQNFFLTVKLRTHKWNPTSDRPRLPLRMRAKIPPNHFNSFTPTTAAARRSQRQRTGQPCWRHHVRKQTELDPIFMNRCGLRSFKPGLSHTTQPACGGTNLLRTHATPCQCARVVNVLQ